MGTHTSSCLENAMDKGAWWATIHGVAELDTTEHTQACNSSSRKNSLQGPAWMPYISMKTSKLRHPWSQNILFTYLQQALGLLHF